MVVSSFKDHKIYTFSFFPITEDPYHHVWCLLVHMFGIAVWDDNSTSQYSPLCEQLYVTVNFRGCVCTDDFRIAITMATKLSRGVAEHGDGSSLC